MTSISSEHRLLVGKLGRIRTIKVHQGLIYLLSDSNNGKLYQLSPE